MVNNPYLIKRICTKIKKITKKDIDKAMKQIEKEREKTYENRNNE